MNIIAALLTVVLVLDCLFLGLLILVQLPKKEAGVGMAFGGGAADALFGAGSGTALSNLTKYSAGIFFALVFLLSILNTRAHHSESAFKKAYAEQPAPVQSMAPAPMKAPAAVPAVSNGSGATLSAPMIPAITNTPAAKK